MSIEYQYEYEKVKIKKHESGLIKPPLHLHIVLACIITDQDSQNPHLTRMYQNFTSIAPLNSGFFEPELSGAN